MPAVMLSASSYCLYVVWPLATLLVSLHRCTTPTANATKCNETCADDPPRQAARPSGVCLPEGHVANCKPSCQRARSVLKKGPDTNGMNLSRKPLLFLPLGITALGQ